MGILVDWGDEDETILMWRFPISWTGDDFYQALQITQELVSEKTCAVDVLVDMQKALQSPTNLLPLFKNGLSKRIPNLRHIIIISQSRYFVSLYAVLQKLGRDFPKLHFVENANEGYELLHYLTASRRV